jgi:hypothetical protein
VVLRFDGCVGLELDLERLGEVLELEEDGVGPDGSRLIWGSGKREVPPELFNLLLTSNPTVGVEECGVCCVNIISPS